LREKIAGGDWSKETQQEVHDAVDSFAKDFGYDLDEEGQPLDDDAPAPAGRSDGERGAGDEGQDQPAGEARDESTKEPAAA
jgi:F-type H+-transporting ATPase subunit alpha